MNARNRIKLPQADREGMALIITLAFIVLVTILVVGLNSLMMVERSAANSHFEKTRAAQYAQAGVEEVVAKLDQNISDPSVYWVSQPGRLTVKGQTQPVSLCSGIPTTSLPSAAPSPAVLQAPNLNISTLQDPGTHLITERMDSNTGQVISMPVKWIYARRSGSVDYAEAPALMTGDPIDGRYAYWADDESCKINDNLAWGRNPNNKAQVGDPTMVDLTALQDPANPGANLTQQMADAIHGFITPDAYQTLNHGFFNTPKEARQVPVNGVVGPVAATLENYKFEVTHYNHDPDTTFFNEPRIVLTTRPDRAGWTYDTTSKQWRGKNGLTGSAGLPHYIRILTNETIAGSLLPQNPAPASGTNSNLNPGPLSSMGIGAVSDTVNLLMTYLKRTDWPMVKTGGGGGNSFQAKYFSAAQGYQVKEGQLRLAQLAVNIIDYVRSKESPDMIVPPMRLFAKEDATTKAQTYTLQNGSQFPSPPYASYMGASRALFVTEIGCYCNPNDTSSTITPNISKQRMTVVVEIYCPLNYGISKVAMNTLSLFLSDNNRSETISGTGEPIGVSNPQYTDTLSNPYLTPGSYVTVSRAFSTSSLPIPTTATKTYAWRVGVSLTNGGVLERTDLIPLGTEGSASDYNTYALQVPFDKSVTTQAGIKSLQCGDPRINTHTGTWSSQSDGKNSFGQANPVSITQLGTSSQSNPGIAQQDTDGNGMLTDASFYMPSPAGTTAGNFPNPLGRVTSVGELGYIHTGVEGSNVAYTDLSDASSPVIPLPKGIPWRTLRLQPNNYLDTSTVPDWALMDLFTVPSVGYANAKSVAAPHDTAVGGRVNINAVAAPFDINGKAKLTRTIPLTGVLLGCNSLMGDTTKLSFSDTQTIVGNIYNPPPILSPLKNGSQGKAYLLPNVLPTDPWTFVSPGEIVEIKGVADRGESSEELVRQVSNLITARGGVFSVYTVGQALKQTPAGLLVVTGEQRSLTMVERYVPDQNSNASTATAATVKFRPIYCRNLTP